MSKSNLLEKQCCIDVMIITRPHDNLLSSSSVACIACDYLLMKIVLSSRHGEIDG